MGYKRLTQGSLCSLGEKKVKIRYRGKLSKYIKGANNQRLRWSAQLTLGIYPVSRKSCREEELGGDGVATFCLMTP